MQDAGKNSSSDMANQPPLLSDRQVGDLVADRFLKEVRTGMDMSVTADDATKSRDNAWNDLVKLAEDPQKGAVVSAIGRKIEAHDPALGGLSATVERDARGTITGFVFTNVAETSAYREELNNDMRQGMTLKQAQLKETLENGIDQVRQEGVYHVQLQYAVPRDYWN